MSNEKKSSRKIVLEYMHLLYSSYRPDQYADPEGFHLQVGMIFECFSEEVLARATHPLTGIQSRQTFPPSTHELLDFLRLMERVIEGERLIAEREAAGYRWIDEPAENRVGFYNAEGIEWHKRDDVHLIAPPKQQLTIEEQGQRDRAIAVALQRMDAPNFKGELTPDDGRHYDRIAADLAARKARNDLLAAEQTPPEQEAPP